MGGKLVFEFYWLVQRAGSDAGPGYRQKLEMLLKPRFKSTFIGLTATLSFINGTVITPKTETVQNTDFFGPLVSAVQSDDQLKNYLTELKNNSNIADGDAFEGLYEYMKTIYRNPIATDFKFGFTYFSQWCSPQHRDDIYFDRAVVLTTTAGLINPWSVIFDNSYKERISELCGQIQTPYGMESCKLFVRALDAVEALKNPTELKLKLPNVAVILGDHWVKHLIVNGTKYEGSPSDTMIKFVARTMERHSDHRDKISHILKHFDEFLRFSQFMKLGKTLITKKIIAQAFNMYIELMKPGEYVLLPFGWASSTSAVTFSSPMSGDGKGKNGHAMLVELKKVSFSETDLKIFNSGAGIENHPRKRDGEITRYSPYLEYNDIETEALKRYSFFEGLISLTNPVQVIPLDTAGGDDIYKVLMRPFLNQVSEEVPTFYIKSQKAGTCSFSVITAYLITKLKIEEFRATRRQLDIEGWEAGYEIVPDEGQEAIKYEILLRGLQTLARRLYRHSKRDDFVGNFVPTLQAMHEKLKKLKIAVRTQKNLPELKAEDLKSMSEAVKGFILIQQQNLKPTNPPRYLYQGGYDLPRFENNLQGLLKACSDMIFSKDPLLSNDRDFVKSAVIQAIIKEMPNPDHRYWKSFGVEEAQSLTVKIKMFLDLLAVLLGIGGNVTYSALVAMTKLYLAAWICAEKGYPEIFDGYRPTMVYIKNALKQDTLFALKPSEGELMKSLLEWASKLEGDDIFDYRSWKTMGKYMVFDCEDQGEDNSELRLVKNLQNIVTQSQHFDAFKDEVRESYLSSVENANPGRIDDSIILGYLWAKGSGSTNGFNHMRDIAIHVMTFINNVKVMHEIPKQFQLIRYAPNGQDSINVLFCLNDENITGMKTNISSQKMFFEGREMKRGQNHIISEMKAGSLSVDCINDSEEMRIPNIISYYSDEPDIMLMPIGTELLLRSILNPKYNRIYMASAENSEKLLKFLDHLSSHFDNKIKAEGLLNSSKCPSDFLALTSLMWLKSKVLVIMHLNGHLENDSIPRRAIRLELADLLSRSKDFSKSFLSTIQFKNFLHALVALTYTKDDLRDLKTFGEFLQHSIKVAQSTSEIYQIILDDFSSLIMDIEPLVQAHAHSFDMNFILGIFPEFNCERISYTSRVLQLLSGKDFSGNSTTIRFNIVSGVFTINDKPAAVRLRRLFHNLNVKPEALNFESNVSGSDIVFVDNRGHKLVVKNKNVYYVIEDGSLCQAVEPKEIIELNRLGLYANKHQNRKLYDLWICSAGSSVGAIMTDAELNIVMKVSSRGKVTQSKSIVKKATLLRPVTLFDHFEMRPALTSFAVPKKSSLIFSFSRYSTEDGKRLTLIVDSHDLRKISFGQEYFVAGDQSIPYGEGFGRYLVVEKTLENAKGKKSPSRKILIPFFNAVQRWQEPELGETSHTCHFMDLNQDRTVKPLSRTHTLVLAHQLLWAGSYHETFNLLQTIDQNSKLSDDESSILASIIMYPNFSFDNRPEAIAISVHALAYFFRMSSIFGENHEPPYSFLKIVLPNEKRDYEDITEMARDKLGEYYENENNVPVEMRIMNQKQAITSMGWLDLQMMKSSYLKMENVDETFSSPRFSLRRLPKHHSQSFAEFSKLCASPNPSSPYSMFRPSGQSFCATGFSMLTSGTVSSNDICGQSTLLRLSYCREEKSVQGMRRILAEVPRTTWMRDIGSGKVIPLMKKEDPPFKKSREENRKAFKTDHVAPVLDEKPVMKIKIEILEAETLIDLPKAKFTVGDEPGKILLEQSCAEDGYCEHRYGFFNDEIEKGRSIYVEKSKNAEMHIRKLSEIFEQGEELQYLAQALTAAIAKETETKNDNWTAVKKLSIEILQSSPGAQAYFMKTGRMSVKPNRRSLTNAFIRESIDDYLEIYPGATEGQIKELHARIGEFYASETRLQHFQRAQKLAEKIFKYSGVEKNSHRHEKRLAFIRALKEELADKASRAYRTDEFPVFAVFESFADVRLRKDQVEVLKTLLTKTSGHTFDSKIVQMMMSGGKTFVLGTLLAFCKADGYHLSTIIVPQSLFETNYLDMKDRSWKFFRQPCFPFTFDRSHRSTSIDNIKMLLQKLYSVIKHRGYIITTPQSMQNLANTFTEYLNLSAPSFHGPAAQSLMMIKELLHIFLTRGAATFDEIDLNFVPTKELNFPTSAKKGPDEVVLETMKRVFYWIATDKKLKSKLDVVHNRQALLERSEHPEILSGLIDLLYEDFCRNKNHRNDYLLPEKLDEKAFKEFMITKMHSAPPDLIKSAYLESESTQQSIGLQRLLELHYILHTDLLQALTRTVNLHFGPSFKDRKTLIAKPYVAANTPSETSDFAGKWETVCKTFIMFLSNGICVEFDAKRMQMFMKFLRSRSKNEARESGESDLAKTEASIYFSKATGEDLFFTEITNTEVLKKLHKMAADKSVKSVKLVLDFVQTQVLLPLKVHLDQIYSFPLNVPSMFNSSHGYSGTIDEIFNFPHDIIFPGQEALEKGQLVSEKVRFDSGSSGWIITNLIQEDNHLITSGLSDDDITIEKIMEVTSDNHRVLIDLGALFKGTSNLQVAKGLAKYFGEKKDNEIGAVLFFDNFTDRLMYIKVGEDKENEIAGTSSALIKSTTKLPHSRLFTYLDNNHFTGVDILQMFDSRAIITTNSEFTTRDLVQAIMRMRGFLKKQRVDLLIAKDLKLYMESKKYDLSLTGLVTMSVRNSIDLEQKYYERVGFQKLTNFYRQFILKKIIEEENPSVYGKLYVKLAELFKRSSEKNYFSLTFGTFTDEKIFLIMEEYSKPIIALFAPYVTAEEIEFLKSTTDQIIAQGQKFISRKLPYKSNFSFSFDSEATVEVSSQVETEQQMEQNTTTVDGDNLHEDVRWEEVNDNNLTPRSAFVGDETVQILALKDALEQTENSKEFATLFDPRLCASINYLYYEKTKICLFDINQKQIHSLLVVVDKMIPSKIKNLIVLANKEADELSELLKEADLKQYDVYLIDAFGTILEAHGIPSAEVIDDLKMLLLDAHLLSGNIENLGQGSFSAKLKDWVAVNTGLKFRFINEVVRKAMNYLKSSDILMAVAYRMLKELNGENFSVITGDIFAQALEAKRINEIYMSILEHTNYFGVQCNRFGDYLAILRDLEKVIDYPETPTYRKICDLLIPRLVEHCTADDEKVHMLLDSVEYVDDNGKVIESLKKLAARNTEYQKYFDHSVRHVMRPDNFIIRECHALRIYYASIIIDDETTSKKFAAEIESMRPDILHNLTVYLFMEVTSRRNSMPDHFKPIVAKILENYMKIDPYGIISGLMIGKQSPLKPFFLGQLGTIKEKVMDQKIALGDVARHYVNGSEAVEDIFTAEERKELFNKIYCSGSPILSLNQYDILTNIEYVYRDHDVDVLGMVLKLADADMHTFRMTLNNVFSTKKYRKGDLRDFIDNLMDLASERPDVAGSLLHPDSLSLPKILEYLKREYPVYSRTLGKMLLNSALFSPLPVLEYAAKTFVTDKAFLKFLDNFLRDRPEAMHHYVRSCISVGSLEYLKLDSFMDQHYHDGGFNIDYFLSDFVSELPQAPSPPGLVCEGGVLIESDSESD